MASTKKAVTKSGKSTQVGTKKLAVKTKTGMAPVVVAKKKTPVKAVAKTPAKTKVLPKAKNKVAAKAPVKTVAKNKTVSKITAIKKPATKLTATVSKAKSLKDVKANTVKKIASKLSVTKSAVKKAVKASVTKAVAKKPVAVVKAKPKPVAAKKVVAKKASMTQPAKTLKVVKAKVASTIKTATKKTTVSKTVTASVAKVPTVKKVAAPKPIIKSIATPNQVKKEPVPVVKKQEGKKMVSTMNPLSSDKKQAIIPEKTHHMISGVEGILPYKPVEGETYMNEAHLKHFRLILEAMRQQLMEDVDRTVNDMRDSDKNLSDVTDRATNEEEMFFMLRTRTREGKLLKKIEEALDRVEHHDYGFCDTCGVEIGIRRLEARPTATLCIDCKTLDEIREKQRGG